MSDLLECVRMVAALTGDADLRELADEIHAARVRRGDDERARVRGLWQPPVWSRYERTDDDGPEETER